MCFIFADRKSKKRRFAEGRMAGQTTQVDVVTIEMQKNIPSRRAAQRGHAKGDSAADESAGGT